jgi:kynurenine formamidase
MEAKTARLVDLTHSYNEQTVYWPTEKGFILEKEFAGMTKGGYFYAANRFSAPEHGGTHLDAPIHFAEGKQTVEQIPLERLVGPGITIDVSAAAKKNRDYQATLRDFMEWEKQHGEIPKGTIVLLRTGFSQFWPDPVRYLGTAEKGEAAVKKLRFPGLHPEAARWLVEQRGVAAVGIDTASIDRGASESFETHRALFEKNVPAFENLADLDRLPAKGFTIVALPMKIEGGSGAPLRIIAILDK